MLVQHCSHHLLGCHWQMHNLLPEFVKFGSVQGFCPVISDHLVCWTISDVNVAFGLLVCNIEVLDVQVMRGLASTLASVGLKQHCILVVLTEDILLDGISLGRQFHQQLPLPLEYIFLCSYLASC